jgi:two-component sensor histidine kinase
MDTEMFGHDLKLRQRELLADLGAFALKTDDLDEVLQEACRLIAVGLNVHFAKVLEYLPREQMLLVRAGVGWREGVVGRAELDAGAGSPAGHALRTDLPVISNDLSTDSRFRTPELLLGHGIERAMNVIVPCDPQPFGVLEADNRQASDFSELDIAFIQGAANLVGLAVERARRNQQLRTALESRDLLLREADHRVKNSLQLVASLLILQRSRLSDEEAAGALDDAIARVCAVAETHRALQQSKDLRTIALGDMLPDLCAHVGLLSNKVKIHCHTVDRLEMDAERAIPLGLIVTELLTNAVRHAYPSAADDGHVEVSADVLQGELLISVSDTGRGVPPETSSAGSLGTTIVRALTKQIGAQLELESSPGQGTKVTLRLPRR